MLAALRPASAHEEDFPIYPVNVEIKVDPGVLTAVIDMQAVYLYDAMLDVPDTFSLPATNWPVKIAERAKACIEKWFTLRLDGRPLADADFSPRFIQEPLRPENSRFQFTLHYPLPQAQGRLSGRAAFFEEYKNALRNDSDTKGAPKQFFTNLAVVGRETVHFELPLDKPEFDLPLDGMARSNVDRQWDYAKQLAFRIFCSPFFWIALIFITVEIRKRWLKRKRG